jgi:hypothetical protein
VHHFTYGINWLYVHRVVWTAYTCYLQIAYYKRGNVTDFVKLLESSGSEASLDYAKFEDDQMTALDTLAAHYVNEVGC